MIVRATMWTILIVSCAHALVHVYELSLPSVEQLIAADFHIGKQGTGWLATCWRLPWGLGALLAGWLVDRVGPRKMLSVYLFGCALTCVAVALSTSLPMLFLSMFTMGAFACIYHPAGLALISHETDTVNLPRALGIHGIFGSAGIGLAPFMAGIVLAIAQSWRTYYWLLTIPGTLLGVVFLYLYFRNPQNDRLITQENTSSDDAEQNHTDWPSYFTLTILAMLTGFTYSAVLSFLPRYMDSVDLQITGIPQEGLRNYLAGAVLLVGCLGQYIAGRIARSDRLEKQLSLVMFCTIPSLLWMALADGKWRIVSAMLFALVHFMHQPIYNSLIAKYTPRHRRSLCYGFSFAMGLGVGSIGAIFAGYSTSDAATYGTLAVLVFLAGVLGVVLWKRNLGSSITNGT